MTEVRKPDSHDKLASVPLIFQLETRMISHQRFLDFLKYCFYSQQLENVSEHAQNIQQGKKNKKKEAGGVKLK